MWLFALFVLVPLIEIALFIKVGGWLTLWPTLGIVIGTAMLGTWLVRRQGIQAMANLRRSFSELDDPTAPLAHGAMILFAGALLLTPGFLTDTLGFLLLIPQLRAAVFRYLTRNLRIERVVMGGQRTEGPRETARQGRADTIDADYEVLTPEEVDDKPRSGKPSGWTQH